MPLDAFLQIKGEGAAGYEINGETQDKMMKTEKPQPFDLSNWTFGIKQDVNVGSGSGGIGAGKVAFEPFTVTKQIDKASSAFFKTCCTGGHYKEATLKIRKAGGTKDASGYIYLQFDFKMVFVSNVSWSHNDPAPQEEIKFDYGAMQITYTPQTSTGAPGAALSPVVWNRVKNNTEWNIE